jgi:hypothetical protein
VYGIKGYGKADKKKYSGNVYNPGFKGAILLRDRFRYGHFTNEPDGMGRVDSKNLNALLKVIA